MQIQLPFTAQPAALPQTAEPAAAPGAHGSGFAQLMANTRSEKDTARPREAAADEAGVDAAEGDGAPAPHAAARPDESRAARLRSAGRAAHAPQAEVRPSAKSPEPTGEAPAQGDKPAVDKATAAMDPALAQWLVQLHLPPADAAAPLATAAMAATTAGVLAPEADVAAAGTGGTDLDTAAAELTRPGARPGERAGAGLAERAGRESPAVALQAATRSAEESKASTASAEREPVKAPASPGFALPAGFEPAAAAAALRAETAAPPQADAPATVAVPVPLDSPEFAQAFGVQVSVLARDGVHEARLQLNPAEMGPVSVQIAMDGERAHIDFGAQAAATRAAIEASLPELAAALRDAGLTLSGGGVSQHNPGRGDAQRGSAPDDARGSTRERASAAAGTNSRPAWRGRVSPGGVDLYA